MNHEHPSGGSFWRSKAGVATCVFLAIAAILIALEHRAHAMQWLPWLILLACPLMHLFMHHGHSHRGGKDDEPPGGGKG